MSGENLPTETAAKFAAATSRDSARKLLGGIFSLDRFQYVLRFVRYLNLAESDDKLKNWCQSIWVEVGLSVLLSQLRARSIPNPGPRSG
ncbi:hypothetical protein E4U09_006632 [Claviceps aff. purpurea]|uniref:Uncharacterized protein n=1 Tax=Claviceps aff. purpurea TaxID=1967640 RepID=A0A9P7TW05_9HYPO|nr:hypothetical protein E4U38_006404 [Claviceps purpurea]KAG6286654.1 hypothetical protein E4U09_006632 [Claviceps aff. purpurea]